MRSYFRAAGFGYGLSPNASSGFVFAMRLVSATEIPSLCNAVMKSSNPWGLSGWNGTVS